MHNCFHSVKVDKIRRPALLSRDKKKPSMLLWEEAGYTGKCLAVKHAQISIRWFVYGPEPPPPLQKGVKAHFHAFMYVRHMRLVLIFYRPVCARWVIWLVLHLYFPRTLFFWYTLDAGLTWHSGQLYFPKLPYCGIDHTTSPWRLAIECRASQFC